MSTKNAAVAVSGSSVITKIIQMDEGLDEDPVVGDVVTITLSLKFPTVVPVVPGGHHHQFERYFPQVGLVKLLPSKVFQLVRLEDSQQIERHFVPLVKKVDFTSCQLAKE